MSAAGSVITPLNISAARTLLEEVRGEGFDAIAIALLHGYNLRMEHHNYVRIHKFSAVIDTL